MYIPCALVSRADQPVRPVRAMRSRPV